MKTEAITTIILLTGFFLFKQGSSESKSLKLMEHQIVKDKVHFKSGSLTLAGNLYKPKNFYPSKKYPAIITGGSLTSIKEQMAGTYAEKLAEKGFVALAFDYSNWGESEGQPRQYEDPALKLRDLEAAVTYLLSQSYVQAVGALGICTSGGNVAYLAADDKRIKAAAVAAAHMADPSTVSSFYSAMGKNIDSLRIASADAKKHYELTGENKIIPAYSSTDKTASHIGPMEYYTDQTRAPKYKEWKNEFSAMSWGPWLDFDPVSKAEHITIPFLMFHSDRCALPENAKKFYNKLNGKKELMWGNGYHFDYYDQPTQINEVIEKVSNFFQENVK